MSSENRNTALSISELVRTGRATPHEAAMLLQLRREIAWRRTPIAVRLLVVIIAMLIGDV